MEKSEILEKVKNAFAEVSSFDREDVRLESNLYDDLGLDSLDLLEAVFILEKEFSGYEMSGDQNYRTVEDVFQDILRQVEK